MTDVPHIPALRLGKPYESLDQLEVKDHRTGELKAKVSQVNAGIIRKDLTRLPAARAVLKKIATSDLLNVCARAGEAFLIGELPLGARVTNKARNSIWKRFPPRVACRM
jgi:hypothetical protein